MRTSIPIVLACCGGALLTAACSEDPQYIRCDPAATAPACTTAVEVGVDGSDVFTGTATITLPIQIEKTKDADARAMRAAQLGVDVPYVRIGDLEVSIEWTIKNLSQTEGEARIKVNGGNQYFFYVPSDFVFDPQEDELPPPLMGDIPMRIPGGGQMSGVLREDQVREASFDLEQITRGMVNPFAAMLTVNENDPGVTIMGVLAPVDALGQITRFDLEFDADRHMVMEYDVRVRDLRGIVHDKGLFAPAAELTAFDPAEFMPPPPPPN